MEEMTPIDAGVDSAVLLEAEIETLAIRLLEIDPNGILRLEQIVHRIKNAPPVVGGYHH